MSWIHRGYVEELMNTQQSTLKVDCIGRQYLDQYATLGYKQ